MFMFWSKRTVLTRRLLKAKVRGEHETECEAQEDSSSRGNRPASSNPTVTNNNNNNNNTNNEDNDTSNVTAGNTTTGQVTRGGGSARPPTSGPTARGGGRISSSKLHQGCCGGDPSQDDDEDPGRLLRCKELLKTLKENQLEMLLTAVESCGADLGSCVLVPRQQPDLDNDHHQHQQQHQQQPQQQQQYYRHRYHHHHHFYHSHHHHHCHRAHRGRHHRSSSLENYTEEEEEEGNSSEDSSSTAAAIRPERCRVRGSSENATVDPHLLCCQIWRWPDLAHSSELKRLPVCHSAKDPVYVCCNPYHWSRLCKPESPPPPYCLIADRLRPEDRAPSEGDQRRSKSTAALLPVPGSLTTNGEGETGQKEWCTLAYWELGGRVGRLYPVEPSTVNVFDSLHDGDGLCLATLAENHAAPPAVQRTRSKIGLGLMLSQEADGVWAYNRSDSPIFVNSPTLDDPESRTLLVYRVPPGFCLNIFDRAKVLQLPYTGPRTAAGHHHHHQGGVISSGGFASGPVDINSVRISFAKGWGPKYSRQEVTSCPCWLEVLLAPCR